jgi:hypothetical protein
LALSEAYVEAHVRYLLMKLGVPESEDGHRRVLAVLAHLSSTQYPDAIELPEAFIVDGWVRVVVGADEVPLGFSVVIPREDSTHELDGLFVEPAQMQRGLAAGWSKTRANVPAPPALFDSRLLPGPPRASNERVGFQVVCATETRFGNAVRMQRLL